MAADSTRTAREAVTLAIATAGLTSSAAVATGDTVLASEQHPLPHGQAEALLPMIDAAMRRAGLPPAALDEVAVTVGPGSFTGIRVGLAAARGIALATGARLVGVSGFEAAAAGVEAGGGGLLLVALESRREDLYVQLLDTAGAALGAPQAVMPAALGGWLAAAAGDAAVALAGDAAGRAAAALAGRRPAIAAPRPGPEAVSVVRAARRLAGAARPARAFYLRPPDVTAPRPPTPRCRIEPVAFAAIGVLALLHPRSFPEDPWDVATLGEIFRLPGFFGRIAWHDARPAGFVLALDLGNECEILSLGVDPPARRRRVGLALLDCVCTEARRRRAERVVLEVAVDNATALSLYRARGFARVGRRPRYYQREGGPIDALVLALSLTPPPLST